MKANFTWGIARIMNVDQNSQVNSCSLSKFFIDNNIWHCLEWFFELFTFLCSKSRGTSLVNSLLTYLDWPSLLGNLVLQKLKASIIALEAFVLLLTDAVCKRGVSSSVQKHVQVFLLPQYVPHASGVSPSPSVTSNFASASKRAQTTWVWSIAADIFRIKVIYRLSSFICSTRVWISHQEWIMIILRSAGAMQSMCWVICKKIHFAWSIERPRRISHRLPTLPQNMTCVHDSWGASLLTNFGSVSSHGLTSDTPPLRQASKKAELPKAQGNSSM